VKKAICVPILLVLILMPLQGNTADAIEATLDALILALREQTGVPGLSAAISIRGNLIWHGEAGFADIAENRRVEPDTYFRLASVSKAVCSIIAAKLVEENSIDVDTRAGDLIPDLPHQYHSLTLRDLMTHTSGLPHYEARDSARGGKNYTSALAGLEQLGDRDLVSPPGTSYHYSTHGFSLASAMMEQATGKTFTTLFESIVLAPGTHGALALESENEHSGLRTRIYDDVANGSPHETERENFSYSWCGAGVESTATGLSVFASSLFGPSGPLREEGLRLLTEPMPNRNGDIVLGERWVMTLGWRRSTDIRGEIFLHHAGVTNGARSVLAFWPKSGLAVSLLSNSSWTGRMEDTAAAFALAATGTNVENTCKDLEQTAYEGVFREEPMAVAISWQDLPVPCRGQLTSNNVLTEWMSRYNFGTPNGHALFRLVDDRWGLVTPIGISILTGDTTRLSGMLGDWPLALTRTNQKNNRVTSSGRKQTFDFEI
jgi:CubicO group peptidase (beta-lactamase class C family)